MIIIPQGYRSQAEDTSQEIDILQFQRWKLMSMTKKAQLIIGANQGCRKLSFLGVKNQYSHLSFSEQRYFYIQRILGENYAIIMKNYQINKDIMIGNPIELALLIAQILEGLEIPYLIGGSLASSLWGESRATLDIDLVADLKMSKVQQFINQVQSLFYVSESAVREAIIHQSSFNLINFDTNEKIDIFILKDTPLAQQEMTRKTRQKITENEDYLYLATAEDIIIQKLIWYRDGNYISDRQWRDILGVLKTQSFNLDFGYLRYWLELENLTDLFNQALRESGLLNKEIRHW